MSYSVYSDRDTFLADNERLGTALPFADDLSPLSQPLTVQGRIAPNRLTCQAMEGCDGTPDGAPGELTIRRYERLAAGGAGIIWFEATACMREGRANPRQLWIREETLDDFKRLVDRIREIGVKTNGYAPLVVMQDTHSGRYSKPDGVPAPLIAYNNPIFEKDKPLDASHIVTDEHIDRVGEALIAGAKLAERAGFDGVDVKCCHRYLNSELLSAYTRPGRYGGSYENRTRLLRESVQGAMAAAGHGFIVSTRLNVYDGFPYPFGFGVSPDTQIPTGQYRLDAPAPAFDPTEPIRLLCDLRALGVELVNVTMGNPYFNPHVNRPFAKGGYEEPEHPLEGVARILNGIGLLHKAVPDLKLISSAMTFLGAAAPHVAAGCIADGMFDCAGFGRMIFAQPDFASRILRDGALDKKRLCLACSKCTELMRAGSTPGCVLRDRLYTDLYREVILKK